MKKLYLHGTSFECAQKIKQEGFSARRETTWVPSVNSEIYLKRLNTDSFDCISSDIAFAIEAATITSAKFSSTSEKIALFLFEIDDDEVELELDYSCPTMDEHDCYSIIIDEINKLDYTLVYLDGYLPWLRLHYLPIGQEYFYFDYSSMSEFEVRAIEKITRKQVNLYNEDIAELIFDLEDEATLQFIKEVPFLDNLVN